MFDRRVIVSMLACTVLAAVLASAGSARTSVNKTALASGGSITVGSLQAFTGLNAHTATQGNTIGLQIGNIIFPSPFLVQPHSNVVLNTNLLTSAQLSANGETIVYKVKPNADWSDGTPVSANDFVYLWQHLNGSIAGISATNNSLYKFVTAVAGSNNGRTVTVTLSEPLADWKSLFSQLLPSKYMASLGADPAAWNTGLVQGNPPTFGPYAVMGNQATANVVLGPNPRWLGPKPKISRVTIEVFSDEQSLIQALESGEVAFAAEPADQTITTSMKGQKSLTTTYAPALTQDVLGFQFSHPIMTPALREAISIAVNPVPILHTEFGFSAAQSAQYLVDNHLLQRGTDGHTSNKPSNIASGNAKAADAVLQQAGYTKGSDGYYQTPSGAPIDLNWTISSDDALNQAVSTLIQAQLKAAGIQIQLNVQPAATYFVGVLIPAAYDALMFGYPGNPFTASWYGSLYTCKGGYNFGRYCNPGVDTAFANLNKLTNRAQERKLFKLVDQRLWSDYTHVPLFWEPFAYIASNKLRGVTPNDTTEWAYTGIGSWSLTGT